MNETQSREDLEREIEETRKRLQELEQKQRELTLVAKIHTFVKSSGKIRITLPNDPRISPYVDILRRITSRVYHGNDNIIDAVDLPHFLTATTPYVNDGKLEISWVGDTKEKYEEYINQPDLLLTFNEKKSEVKVQPGPKAIKQRVYIGSDIQTWTYNYDSGGYYTFSVAEAYKFPKLVEINYPTFRVEYDDRLKEIIEEQAKRSAEILEVLTAKDWPSIPNPFRNPDGSPRYDPYDGTELDLKPVQRVAVKFAEITDDKAIIAYDMGGGKTPISIAIKELRGYKKALAVVPAKAKTHWASEYKKFTGKEARILYGETPDETAISDIIDNKYDFYIINYDILSRASLEEDDGKGGTDYHNKWAILINLARFDVIFVDEAHRIKNTGSKRSKAVRALERPHIIPLTGTPIVNRAGELFANLNLVAPETFSNEGSFLSKFMYSDGTPKNLKQLHEVLSKHMIRRNWKDIHGEDLSPTRIPYKKELSEQARINYNKILEGVYISLRRPDYQRNVASILAELTRCNQICSADNVDTTADLAIEALEETGKKVVIFSQYLESQAGIQECLGKSAIVLNGLTSDDERDEATKKFQDPNSDLKFIVSNLTEIFTWTAGWTVIFNDLWWTAKDHQQAEGRCFGRTNDPHSGNSYWLINENSTDEFKYGLILKKLAIFGQVIDDVKGRVEADKSIAQELIEHLRNSL